MSEVESGFKKGVVYRDIERTADKLYYGYGKCTNDQIPGGGLRAAVAIGRTLLDTGHPASAKRLFTHLLDIISPVDNPEHYIIVGNLGYALTDLSEYDEAIRRLKQLRANKEHYFAWHALALAYAYYKRDGNGDQETARSFVLEARDRPGYDNDEDQEYWRRIYPEIREWIVSSSLDNPDVHA